MTRWTEADVQRVLNRNRYGPVEFEEMVYEGRVSPKPRMTRSDKWKERPCVVAYRAFCDSIRAWAEETGYNLDSGILECEICFAMPESWSKTKRIRMEGQSHQSRPDLSNAVKAIEDALCPKEDSHIWHYKNLKKIWGHQDYIKFVYYKK